MSGLKYATLASSSELRLRTLRQRAGTTAMAWGFDYAVVSLFWLLGVAGIPGGGLGLDQLAAAIRDEPLDRTPSFIAILLVAITAKALASCLGLAPWVPLEQVVPRRLLLTRGWIAGIGPSLYGLAGVTQAAMIVPGRSDAPASMGDGVSGWYLGLWEPLWLIGGPAFLVATRACQLTSAPDRSPYRG